MRIYLFMRRSKMKNNRLFYISIIEIAVGVIIDLLAFSGIVADSDVITGIGSVYLP